MLIDTHAHLDGKRFDKDREDIINDLKNDDVDIVINPGADFMSSVKAVDMSKNYDNIYAAVGIHPHEAKSMDDNTINLLKDLASKGKVVAIGEIGLDYHRDYRQTAKLQHRMFKEQLQLAEELELPVIIHCRKAYDRIIPMLRGHDLRAVIFHAYSGRPEQLKQILEFRSYI